MSNHCSILAGLEIVVGGEFDESLEVGDVVDFSVVEGVVKKDDLDKSESNSLEEYDDIGDDPGIRDLHPTKDGFQGEGGGGGGGGGDEVGKGDEDGEFLVEIGREKDEVGKEPLAEGSGELNADTKSRESETDVDKINAENKSANDPEGEGGGGSGVDGGGAGSDENRNEGVADEKSEGAGGGEGVVDDKIEVGGGGDSVEGVVDSAKEVVGGWEEIPATARGESEFKENETHISGGSILVSYRLLS